VRVALVIERFSPSGGAERACANLARGLAGRGHEVHVFAREIEPAPGVVPHPVAAGGLFPHRAFAGESRRLLAAERFDIVHSFTRTPQQDVLRLGGGIHREYLAQTDSEYSALGRLWRRVRPKERVELALEAASLAPGAYRKVVAVSRRVRDEAVRHYGVRPDDVKVIYNGVDAAAFAPAPGTRAEGRRELGLREDEYALLFCGSGFRRKGLEFAAAAVGSVPGARLLVAGEGRGRPHPRVLYLGRRSDVARLYAAADVLILPTLYDPFPNVCLEAMAAGLPVIVSRIAGVSEIIEGDSLVVEEPRDVKTLAEAVRRLEDPAVRKPMGESARRKAVQFTLERTLEENLRLYEVLTKSRRDFVNT
jgi:UDP-glucose:(heptosyl)LPS alpha-1,3-glucosyltransferase